MKPQFRASVSRLKFFFSRNLSMHIVPLILAVAFVFIAERPALTDSAPAKGTNSVSTWNSFAFVASGNIQHAVSIIRVAQVLASIAR